MGRYTIKQIVIKNLKHFKGDFPIELDGKNLLLYGENGSGKSSIYWALHMFYQSCLKTPDNAGAGKYFDPTNMQNLRNAFANDGDISGVEIIFKPEGVGSDRTFHDMNGRIDTTPSATDRFMQFSLQSSDFLSYKSLSSLYDFRNSQLCDLTQLFEREIFPTMNLSEKVKDLDGNPEDTSNISGWWDAMERYFNSIPRRSEGSKVLQIGSEPYNEFDKRLKRFNELLNEFLEDVNRRTERILRDDFDVKYRILFELDEAKFNQKLKSPGAKKSHRDYKLTSPRIRLKMSWEDNQLSSATHKIKVEHPQSFFNEAKLTIAAFAIRLAIIEMKYAGTSVDSAPIICVDDLLISLDMGNRIPIAERILKNADAYQMFIFTHDISLYNLFISLIPENDRRDNWLCYELYNVQDDLDNPSTLNPHLLESQSYMEKAKVSWQQHDIPAAVNYLRKDAERLLQKLMPLNMLLSKSLEKAKLNDWLQRVPEFVRLYALPSNPIRHMDYFRNRLLNPLSHDDFDTPAYSNELKLCIQELSELAQYEKKDIVKGDAIPSTQFEMTITNGPASLTLEFVCVEKWDYCYVPSIGKHHYKNVDIKVLSTSDAAIVPAKNLVVSLFDIYERAYTGLGYTKRTKPDLEQLITRVSDGMRLFDIECC